MPIYTNYSIPECLRSIIHILLLSKTEFHRKSSLNRRDYPGRFPRKKYDALKQSQKVVFCRVVAGLISADHKYQFTGATQGRPYAKQWQLTEGILQVTQFSK